MDQRVKEREDKERRKHTVLNKENQGQFVFMWKVNNGLSMFLPKEIYIHQGMEAAALVLWINLTQ